MSDTHASSALFPIPTSQNEHKPLITKNEYQRLYAESVSDPEGFWAKQAETLDWFEKWHTVKDTSFDKNNLHIQWFAGGKLNVTHNCIDRHLPHRARQTAIIWEGNDPKDSKNISYQELHDEVCRFANISKSQGVKKGDRVTLYMPMIPEAAYA
ncbi:MAG: AMP-binding protein, partial [Rickettsiales bacterium]|nr:AMP-binding protein [Rickettsiales bacterium]